MRIAYNSLGLIGNTPMQVLQRITGSEIGQIWAKMEIFSPGSSVKDRIAVHMINDALARGAVQPGGTLIEVTAGNTGIALAVAAAAMGFRFICIMPAKFSQEKQQIIEFLGSEVIRTPTEEGMQGAMKKALELEHEIPGSTVLSQFENQANPECHYLTTGREIWEQTGGRVTHVAFGAGTGGTFTGVTRFLKEKNPEIKAYVVETEGSIFAGGQPGPHWVEGIGNDFIPGTLDLDLADGVITVTDAEAKRMVKRLAVEEQILAGGSSGAHVCAALGLAEKLGPESIVVTCICDRLERYISKDILECGKE